MSGATEVEEIFRSTFFPFWRLETVIKSNENESAFFKEECSNRNAILKQWIHTLPATTPTKTRFQKLLHKDLKKINESKTSDYWEIKEMLRKALEGTPQNSSLFS